ncbi:MAG: hypothetical protein EBQ89_01680 [Alphaproteobacteria bacterium]|nr:hypothetical protein [Alphaproteobacteria bacterium]
MTVRELGERMDVAEYRQWLALHRYVNPLGGEWRQTARIVAATLAPYCGKGRTPKEDDFMPTEKPPMSAEQIAAELSKLKR